MTAPLRVLPPTLGSDVAAAERAAAAFLAALGVTAPADTPGRMARAYAELLHPRSFDLTTFPNDEGYDELVLARDIPVRSVCEHHMLPFVGVAHVGYLPGARILGLSKLARVVELHAHRPQVQERLTTQIADAIVEILQPRGAFVMIEAEHLCMSMRGVRKPGTLTLTSAVRGLFKDSAATRAEVMSLIGPSVGRS
jgi:GTP cyclohydrolase I